MQDHDAFFFHLKANIISGINQVLTGHSLKRKVLDLGVLKITLIHLV